MFMPDPKRYLYVYCRSRSQCEAIKRAAKEKRVAVSRFLLSIIEDGLNPDNHATSPETVAEVEALREKVDQMTRDLRDRDMQIDTIRAEKRRLHDTMFGTERGSDIASVDVDLLTTLSQGPVSTRGLLSAMGIDPGDVDQVRTVSRQLEALELTGLVKRSSQGWQWIE